MTRSSAFAGSSVRAETRLTVVRRNSATVPRIMIASPRHRRASSGERAIWRVRMTPVPRSAMLEKSGMSA
jgi:hypothetical protein